MKANLPEFISAIESLSRNNCFLDPYPYADYNKTLRTSATRDVLHQMEQESIVLLENHNALPLNTPDIRSIAIIGPQSDRVSVRDTSTTYLL